MAGGLLEDEEEQSEGRPGQFWCLFVPDGFKPRISIEKQEEPEKAPEKHTFIDPNEVLRDVLGPERPCDSLKDLDEKDLLTNLQQDPVNIKCEPEIEIKADDIGNEIYESSKTASQEDSGTRSSKKDVFKCTPCNFETHAHADLQNHLNLVHSIQKATEYFKCEKCHQKAENWALMKKHLTNHAQSKQIVVFKCSFETKSKKKTCRSRKRENKPTPPPSSPIPEVERSVSAMSSYSDKFILNEEIEPFTPIESVKGDAFTCNFCPFESPEESSYKMHLLSHSEYKFINCDLCSFAASDQEALDAHTLRSHTSFDDKEKLRCSFCKFETRKKLVLRKHLFERHQMATKMVEKDSSKSKSEKRSTLLRLRRSKKEKQEDEWYFCDKCEFKTRFKCSLKTHMIKHRNPDEISREFMCEVCSSCFRTKATLEKHLLRHKSIEEVEHFQCKQCDYKTKFKFNLNKHLLIHKDPSEIKMFQCDICGFQCKRKYNFKNHQLTHKSEEEVPVYRCAVCNYKTKCKDYLAAHLKKGKHLGLRTREKGRKPQCKTCGYETKDWANLYRHTLIHKNIEEMDENKVFRCDQCDYKTLFKIRLQTHSKIHKRMDEVETFNCPHCDYKAKMKGNLKAHIDKVHVNPGERKTFQCHICPLQLKSSSNLKMHLLTHKSSFEIEMIKCQMCSYETKFKSYMRMHLKKKHNILAPSTKRRGISYTNQNALDAAQILHQPVQDFFKKYSVPAPKQQNNRRKATSKKELFKCITCRYKTTLFEDLMGHLKLIHLVQKPSENFKCDKCYRKTEDWEAMKQHLLTHIDWKDLVVFNCNFRAKSKLKSSPKRKPKPRECKALIEPVEEELSDHNSDDDLIEPVERENDSFTCKFCPFDTTDEIAYKEHLRSHEQLKRINSFEADDDSNLKTYLEISHSCLKCSFCKFETRKRLVLRKHMYQAHQIATRMIEKDTESLNKRWKRRGEKKDTSEWFFCDKCDFKTRFKCSLKTHMIKHKHPDEVEKKFMCEECSACFRTKAYLASHMLKHKSLDECQTFQCEYCDYRTKFKYNLTKHILKHKDPSECPMFQCEICGFKCKRKYNFKNHQLTHKNDDEVPVYRCAICAYQTKCKDYLAAHLKKGTHLGQRKRGKIRKFTDTKCNVCGVEMKDPGNLYRHTLTHKNIEEVDENMIFRCDQCDYKTLFKGRLVMHEKIHKRMDEVETFTCPHCDYKSKMKGNLKQHINKVHVHPSERKTFQCHVCSIQLKSSSNLKTHLLTHKSSFEAEMIKCQICSYETKFKSYMRMHLKKKHNIMAPSAKRRGISYSNQSSDERIVPPPNYF